MPDSAVNPLRVLQEAAIAHRDSEINTFRASRNQERFGDTGDFTGPRSTQLGLADGAYFEPGEEER
jgi:hypothetical protein